MTNSLNNSSNKMVVVASRGVAASGRASIALMLFGRAKTDDPDLQIPIPLRWERACLMGGACLLLLLL